MHCNIFFYIKITWFYSFLGYPFRTARVLNLKNEKWILFITYKNIKLIKQKTFAEVEYNLQLLTNFWKLMVKNHCSHENHTCIIKDIKITHFITIIMHYTTIHRTFCTDLILNHYYIISCVIINYIIILYNYLYRCKWK